MKARLKAWTGQRASDVAKRGKRKAPWLVFWNDPNGRRREKSCGPGKEGWRLAEKEKQKIHQQIITGTYGDAKGGSWEEFRAEYERNTTGRLEPSSCESIGYAMDHFARLAKPGRMSAITTRMLDAFVAARRPERGLRPGDTVSPATINKELRHLRTLLRKARKWGYLSQVPDITFEREPERVPQFMPPEHFNAIYDACDAAKEPANLPYPAGDWWRGLLVTAYMTGWRIGDIEAETH